MKALNAPMKWLLASAVVALCIFSISNEVLAKRLQPRAKTTAPRPIYKPLGIKVITPKTGSSYLRRGRFFNPDAARVNGVTWVRGHHVKGQGYRRAHLRKLHTPRAKLEFSAGSHVRSAAQDLVTTANHRGKLAIGLFNGAAIYARPGDAPGKVVARWDKRMKVKSERYLAAKARKAATARPKKPQPTALERLARSGNLLNQQRITTGTKLQGELEKKAKKAGYRAWDFYGVTNLRGAQEISAFAKHYAKVYPKVAKDNIQFATSSGRIVAGTEARWKAALQEL